MRPTNVANSIEYLLNYEWKTGNSDEVYAVILSDIGKEFSIDMCELFTKASIALFTSSWSLAIAGETNPTKLLSILNKANSLLAERKLKKGVGKGIVVNDGIDRCTFVKGRKKAAKCLT